ncbi:hypothetical protein B0A48_08937 [Cryoendolithus antarcticus]|uniref:Uncharacterized protein n=1 Tax=Cryoendolithus antarcticus TaxID=1507870 RepID=A0A1V8T545_9PEZI|nr:hypothetical protein B0A48_08937 [Cryoendolithus antarcticus]
MSVDLTSTIARVPKLAVNNAPSSSTSQTGNINAFDSRPSSGGTTTSRPRTARTDESRTPGQRARNASISTTQSGFSSSKHSPAKRKSGVLGFLTLKEPSTLALQQYAEQQKKASAVKAGTKPPSTRSGVSTQKLPDYVPKVNSKWDGLPEPASKTATLRKRSSKIESTLSQHTIETKSSSCRSNNTSSDGTQSTRRPFGSLSSRPSSLGTPPRSRNASIQNMGENSRVTAQPRSPLTAVHPALRDQTTKNGVHTFLHPPTPEPPEVRKVIRGSDLDLPDLPELEDLGAALYLSTSAEPSPLTPPAHDGRLDSALDLQPHAMTCDGNATFWYSDTDNDSLYTPHPRLKIHTPGTGSRAGSIRNWPLQNAAPPTPLSPTTESSRPYHRFSQHSPPRSPSPTPIAELPATPLYAPSDTTRPSTVVSSDTFQPAHPAVTTFRPPTTSSASSSGGASTVAPSIIAPSIIAPSIAPSTVPSVMSAQWHMPAKQRLGLGGVVRMSEVMPWEIEGELEEMSGGRESRASAKVEGKGIKRLSRVLGLR